MTLSDLLTVSEVAEILELSEPAARMLIVLGDIPQAPFDAAMGVRVRREDVGKYLQRRDHPTSVLWGSWEQYQDNGAQSARELADAALDRDYQRAAARQREAVADRLALQEMEDQPDLAHLDTKGTSLSRREALICLGIGSVAALFWLGVAALVWWWLK